MYFTNTSPMDEHAHRSQTPIIHNTKIKRE